jgi:RHS repeat-associated protein
MRARSLVASFIIAPTLLASAVLALDAQGLKQGTIAQLQSAKTGVPQLDAAIDDAIAHIRLSLTQPNGTSLFSSSTSDAIAPPPDGLAVFDEEGKALDSLTPVAADSRAPAATKAAIANVSSSLAAADRRIATRLVDLAAANAGTNPKALSRLDQARRDLAKGDADVQGGSFKQAITDYENAWLDGARSLLEANPAPVVTGLSPAPGSITNNDQPVLGATIETGGDVLQLVPSSIQLLLDGSPVVDLGANLRTSAVTFDAFGGRATISVVAPSPLPDGVHSVTVRAQATQRSGANLGVGNVGPASVERTWSFTVETKPVALEITIRPSSPSNVVAGSLNDVTVRAVTAHALTATKFTGFVLLACTDVRSPLNGLLLNFQPSDQGSKTITDLAAFLTAGVQTVSATSLPTDGSTPLTGSLTVNVVPGAPTQLVFTQGGADQNVLFSETPAPFAVAIDDAFGNQRTDAGVTVTASIAATGSSSPPLVLTSTTDTNGVAAFQPPLLAPASYVVTVSVPAFSQVPARTFAIQVIAVPTGDVFVRLPTDALSPGSAFQADVSLNVGPDAGDFTTLLGAYDLLLYYDSTRLAVDSVEVVAPINTFTQVSFERPGVVAVSAVNFGSDLSMDESLRGFTQVFRVSYHVKADAPSGTTPIGAEVYDVAPARASDPPQHLGGALPRPSVAGSGRVTIVGSPGATDLRVIAATPFATSPGVDRNAELAFLTSAPVDPSSLAAAVQLSTLDGVAVPVNLGLANGGMLVTVTPQGPLDGETIYTLTVSTAFRSASGASLSATFTQLFKTAGDDPVAWGSQDYVKDGRPTAADALYRRWLGAPGIIAGTGAVIGDVDTSVVSAFADPGVVPLREHLAGDPTLTMSAQEAVAYIMGHSGYELIHPKTPASISPQWLNDNRGRSALLNMGDVTLPGTWNIKHSRIPVEVAGNGNPPTGFTGVTKSVYVSIDGSVWPSYHLPEGKWDIDYVLFNPGASPQEVVFTPNPTAIFDRTKPTILSFTADNDTTRGQFTLRYVVADENPFTTDVSLLSMVELYERVNGILVLRASKIESGNGSAANPAVNSFSNINLSGQGYHYFVLKATDRAGNSRYSTEDSNGQQTLPALQVYVDTNQPTLTLEAAFPAATQIGPITFRGHAWDDHSDTVLVQLSRHAPSDPPGTFPTLVASFTTSGRPDPNNLANDPRGSFTLTDPWLLGSPPSEGAYDYKIAAFDQAMNETDRGGGTFIFDTTRPISLHPQLDVSPAVLSQPTPAFIVYGFKDAPPPGSTATPSGLDRVEIYRNARIQGIADQRLDFLTRSYGGQLSVDGFSLQDTSLTSSNAVDDDYTYYAVAYDRAGNPSFKLFAAQPVVRDTSPPVITFATLPTYPYLSSKDIAASAKISDRSNLQNIRIIVSDGVHSVDATTIASIGVFNGTLSTTAFIDMFDLGFTEGTFNVTISAEDIYGHSSSASQNYILDRSPPSITITSPADGARTNQSAVTLAATWSDAVSGVDLNTAKITMTPHSGGPAVVFATPPSITASGFTTTQQIQDGVWDLKVEIQDKATNKASAQVTFTVDTTPPVVSLPLPTDCVNNPLFPISGTVTDLLTGVDPTSFHLVVGTTDVTATTAFIGTSAPGQTLRFQFKPTTPIPDGIWPVKVTVADVVGNTATATGTLIVDATPPTAPGKPVGAARPRDGNMVVRWLPSVDFGPSGLAFYKLEVSDDNFATIALSQATTNTFAELPPPATENTRYRLSAFDECGNQSPVVDVGACEVFCVHDLSRPVTTVIQVRLVDEAGLPVQTATVATETSAVALAPTATPGLFQSGSVSTSAGTSLSLRIDATTPTSPTTVTVLSGSLMAADFLTDFGTVVVPSPHGTPALTSAGGVANVETSVGATVGEPAIFGPPPLGAGTNLTQASLGFWHLTDGEGAYAEMLLPSPAACCQFIPTYYLLFDDAPSTHDVQFQFSADGGINFVNATNAAGGDGVTGLAAGPLGVRHVFLWNAGNDLKDVSSADVILRVSVVGDPRSSTAGFTYLHPFQCTSVVPSKDSEGNDPNGAIVLTFNRTIDPTSVPASVQLVDLGTMQILGMTATASNNQIVLQPAVPLPTGAWCEVAVISSLRSADEPGPFDQDPRQLGMQPFTSTFRVGGVDTAPPRLVSSTPADAAGNVDTATTITLVFDKALDPTTVVDTSFSVVAGGSNVAKATALSPDQTTVTLTPSAPLPVARLVTVAVGPGVKSAQGVALGRYVAVNFTTAATILPPSTPTIDSPAEGDVVSTTTPTVSGHADPLVVVRLLVNGVPSSLAIVSSATGGYAINTYPLVPGIVRIQAVAERFDGSASAPSTVRTFFVAANEPPPSPPPLPGDPPRHEIIAGPVPVPVSGKATDRVTLVFDGPPGQSFVVAANGIQTTPLAITAGFQHRATINVDPANGGDGTTLPITLSQNLYGAPGQFKFDPNGKARMQIVASDVVKEGYRFSLANVANLQSRTLPQDVLQKLASAAVAGPSIVPTTGADYTVGVRSDMQMDPSNPPDLESGALRQVSIEAVAVDANGQPDGSKRVDVTFKDLSNGTIADGLFLTTTDDNGNANFEMSLHSQPFYLHIRDMSSVVETEEGGFAPDTMSFQGPYYPEDQEQSDVDAVMTNSDDPDPQNNPDTGCGDDKGEPADSGGCGSPDAPVENDDTEPVTYNNGQLTESRVDLAVPGRGAGSFAFARTYKSYVLYDGPLGRGWNHGYDMRVRRLNAQTIQWITGTDRVETYQLNPDGTYRSPTGFFVKLSGPDSGLQIRTPNGTRYVFRPLGSGVLAPGKLDSIADRHGNALRFDYGTNGVELGRLVHATDAYGRGFRFSYNVQGRIAQLTDETLGRVITYSYSGTGDLIKVTGPAVMTTTRGVPLKLAQNLFPNGKSEVYGYTSGFADERLNHKLVLVVAPKEAQSLTDGQLESLDSLRPLARAENTWNIDPLDPVSFGRIKSQRWGGTNETGIAAGGTITFDYQSLVPAGMDPSTLGTNDPYEQTTVKDRNGNLVDYTHNRLGNCIRCRRYANRNLRLRGTGPGQDPDSFDTVHLFNADGQRLSTTLPLGNQIVYGFASTNPDRNAQGNLTAKTLVPDAVRLDSRGGIQPRTITFQYEPVYQELCQVTDERGNDLTYTPQNGGTSSPARYTTTSFFDYQQSTDVTGTLGRLSQETGLDVATLTSALAASNVSLGLGDLNADPSDDTSIAGDVVKVEAPTVTLVPGQTQEIAASGGTAQHIATLLSHNAFGQITRVVDPERNVHTFRYFPSNDPDGDGIPVPGNTDTSLGGYLAESDVDTASDAARDSGRNPTPVSIRRLTFYDPVGNAIRMIDGRGIEHIAEFNSLNQVVHTVAANATSGVYDVRDQGLLALEYEAHFIYDANDNLAETRVANQGERTGDGQPSATNPAWTTKRRFDILDDVVTVIREVDPIFDDDSIGETSPGVIVTGFRYDANQNLNCVIKPEGNVDTLVWDERNRLFQTTRGWGSAEASTTTRHYDLNSNLQYVVSAVKKNSSKNAWAPGDVSTLRYDGFDRHLCTEDPEGNCGDTVYDPADNRVRFIRHGPDEEGEPRLFEAQWLYDELGRTFRSDVDVFTYPSSRTLADFQANRTIPTIADGAFRGEQLATTLVEFDALSRVVHAIDPKQDDSVAEYDGASRLIHTRGPAFATRTGSNSKYNEVRSFYDGASNLIRTQEFERTPAAVPHGPTYDQSFDAEIYLTDFVYDAVGRLVRVTDPVGQTSRLVFDSRSNLIAATDAKGPLIPDPLSLRGAGPGATINDHGNVSRVFYDGLSRPIRTERLLKVGGKGDGSFEDTNLDMTNSAIPTGIVTTTTTWDRNSRVTGRIDANGNMTACHFDALDRCDVRTFADGSVSVTKFDQDDDLIQTTDPNGTIVARTFDGASRLVKVQVTRKATNLAGTGQDVLGSALQAFEYDGLSRLRSAIDDNGDATNLGVACDYVWDSVSRKQSEHHRINAAVIANNVFTTNGRITVGTAQIDRTVVSGYAPQDSDLAHGALPDPLDARVFGARTSLQYSTSGRRLQFGIDGLDRTQTVQDGALQVVGYEFVGGRTKEKAFGNGVLEQISYDPDRRLESLTHTDAGSNLIAGFSYQYDRANNRLFEASLHKGGAQDVYTYDSLSRVTGVDFGVPAGGGAPAHSTQYQLDGVHNFVARTEDGVTTKFNTRVNGAYAFDFLNRYSRIDSFDALTNALLKSDAPTHDVAGARIRDTKRRMFFDAFERLVRVDRSFDGGQTYQTVGAYTYDPMGRRVTRRASVYLDDGTFVRSEDVAYVSDGAREIEELRLSDGALLAENVFGSLYVDEPVQMRRGGATYYLHSNSMFSTAAVTDGTVGSPTFGQVVEQYDYRSIYGVHLVRDGFGSAVPAGAGIGNTWRFQGRRFDEESGLYHYRARMLDPAEGRFVSRDPLLDPANLGSQYAFCGGNPVNAVDPFGTDDETGTSVYEMYVKPLGSCEFWSNTGHGLWNAASFGALDRQEKLINQANEKGNWGSAEYWGKTGSNAAGSFAKLGVVVATGGAGSAGLAGTALTTQVVGGTAIGLAGAGADIAVEEVTNANTTGERQTTEQVRDKLVGGAAAGAIGGGAAAADEALAARAAAARAAPTGGEPAPSVQELRPPRNWQSKVTPQDEAGGFEDACESTGDETVKSVRKNELKRVRLSAEPEFDPSLPPDVAGESGYEGGRPYIRVGPAGTATREQTGTTILHEERHLRLDRMGVDPEAHRGETELHQRIEEGAQGQWQGRPRPSPR